MMIAKGLVSGKRMRSDDSSHELEDICGLMVVLGHSA